MATRREFLLGAAAAGVAAAVAADGLLELAGDRKFFLPPRGGWARGGLLNSAFLGGFGLAQDKPEGGRIAYDYEGDGCSLNNVAHPVTLMRRTDSRGVRLQWVRRDAVDRATASGYRVIDRDEVEWWEAPPMPAERLVLDPRALETIEIEIPESPPGFYPSFTGAD